MLRALAAVAIVLLSGCLASAPAPLADEPVADDDGLVVTATRVEPLLHLLDVTGRIATHPCQQPATQCDITVLGRWGLAWDRPVQDVADPAALFWRVALGVDWHTESLVDQMGLSIAVTTPCGIACVREREVLSVESDGRAPITLERTDIYLQPGETGLRIRLEPIRYAQTTVGEASIDYRLHGAVAGYRPAAAPVVIA